MKEINICEGYKTVVYKLAENEAPAVYVHMDERESDEAARLLTGAKLTLIAVDGVDWDAELSPWPEPKAFKGGEDFSGGAKAYLEVLTGKLIPETERAAGLSPEYRAIAGYSLAGLFALWSLYETEDFTRAATVSGSLWYDGFLDFMRKNRPVGTPEKVYFSLGDRESATKNQRMATVESRTAEAEKLMSSLGARTVFQMNEGGHFVDAAKRTAAGIRWLVE